MILSVLLTHLKGSWLFSCFGSLKTQKSIKHILSSVKKDAPKGIFTYFRAFVFCISTDFRTTMEGFIVLITILKGRKLKRHVFKTTGANRFLIYTRCKFNLRLYVYKLSKFWDQKRGSQNFDRDKISIKSNNSILNWWFFYWAFCKMIISIWYNVTVSSRWNRTTQLISWSSYTQQWHFRVRKVPQQDWLSRYSAFLFFPVTVNVQNKKQQQQQ